MRPPILYPLFAALSSLSGVGPRTAPLLEKLAGGNKVVDLLWLLPTSILDRRQIVTVAEAPAEQIVTLVLTVDEHLPPANRRSPYRVRCHDSTGAIVLTFFRASPERLKRDLPIGTRCVVSGRVEYYHGIPQIAHPDRIAPEGKLAEVAVIEPVYPLTAGLAGRTVARVVEVAISKAPVLPEWQDPAWLARHGWPSWREALVQAHAPQAGTDLAPDSPARARLAFDELLANQLALAVVRQAVRRQRGRALIGGGHLRAALAQRLGFGLTDDQSKALEEILADMREPLRMLRLLQGDVGSGKTVVAFMAMLNAVEAGAQSVLLAPTEILARQHFETINPLASAIGVKVDILTARAKGAARKAILSGLSDGQTAIVIGTHALLQEDVDFSDLSMAVVDEQHRFGVHQRLALSGKGQAIDVLVMTATPIPRTLQLTAYGDMDVSRIRNKPPGRKPVRTVAMPTDRMADIIDRLRGRLAEGEKVYWVCPLVEEGETLDVTNATERWQTLRAVFGNRVTLVHGRMKASEKDAAMQAFAGRDADILVATTVIEVGVDVPEATIMVIEHAERFGLAQLHQLRGRVGRGSRPATCILLYGSPLGETARRRLATLRETDDGFIIAEEDLRLRGAGEMLGTRQSGLPGFRVADVENHTGLMEAASDQARLILHRDPGLTGEIGRNARILLYLFERDAAVRYLQSG